MVWLKEIEKAKELGVDIDFEEVYDLAMQLSKFSKGRSRGVIIATVIYALLKKKCGTIDRKTLDKLLQIYNTDLATVLRLKKMFFPREKPNGLAESGEGARKEVQC